MIRYDVEQGSPEWLSLRMGKPTASEAEAFMNQETGALGSGASSYADRLIFELMAGRPMSRTKTRMMERGNMMEQAASERYQFETGHELSAVGAIATDDGFFIASPDREVVGEPGFVEIKCPSLAVHMGYALYGFGRDYYAQAQAQMLVDKSKSWVDRYSFHPDAPFNVRERTPRDTIYINKMRDGLKKFRKLMDERIDLAMGKGLLDARPWE